MRRALAFLLLALVAPCPAALASGFLLDQHSARALGMGNAFTGLADTAAAAFFNPGGLGQLRGLHLEAGLALLAPSARYDGAAPGSGAPVTIDAERQLFWLPHLHVAYRLHERVVAALSVHVPFGLGMAWPSTVSVGGESRAFWGRSIVRRIRLESVALAPTLALQVNRQVCVGFGISIVKAAVSLERAVTLSARLEDDVDVELSGGDVGFGMNAGVLFRAIPKLLHVGVSLRSGAPLTFNGKAAFTRAGRAELVPAGLRARLTDGPVKAPLDLPHVLSVGAVAFATPKLALALAMDVVTWNNFRELQLEFTENPELSVAEPKRWKTIVVVHLGAEYRLRPNLPLRAGFVFKQSPVPADTLGPELPDGHRYEVSLGLSYAYRAFSADLAYLFMLTGRTPTAEVAPLPGEYRNQAHVAMLGLRYAWDRARSLLTTRRR
ncbi:MAG: outer membrane protein transport protein [Deltaproteobacteria bacterium]|nr:outer membrane protein transport protein [Deltaproteobacteria bacterium]